MQEFFQHENQACLPYCLQCLETDRLVQPSEVDVKILDGAVLVNMLPPGKSKIFEEYTRNVSMNYIVSQAESVTLS